MLKSQSTLGKKGIYMSKFRTHIGVILAMALAVSPVALYSATAATGGPKDSYITLQTPFLDATNTSEARSNQQMADGWVAKGWFGSGLVFQVSFAPVGSTINLTYNVKDKNGKVLAFTPVNLRINKGYSEASSILQVDGVKTKGIDRPPFDQANVIRRTDAFGNITFAVKNLDLEALGEPEPESFTSKPIFSEDKLDRLHSQMLPEVNSEPADHSVITEFHYYIPKTPIVVAATKPTITLVTPKLDATNSVLDAAKNLKQAYAPLGGDLVVVYKVTGDNGRAVPNKAVNPFSMPATSTAFTNLTPEIVGATPVAADAVEFHYYRGISTSVAKSGKDFVVSVAIAGAAGKSATVAVTGAKKASVKLSSAMQVVPVKVSGGAKTVTVVVDGKTYTSKVVAK